MRLKTAFFAAIMSFAGLVSAMPAVASSVPVAGTDYFMTVSAYASGETSYTSPNYYVGLTTITIYADNHGTKGNIIATYLGFCIDFQHQISVPDTYLVVAQDVGAGYVSSIGGYSNAVLEEDAALGNMFNGVDTSSNRNDAYVQIDIWNVGGASFSLNSTEWADLALAQAASHTSLYTGYTNNLAFEEIGGDGQSFMVDLPPTTPQTPATPEPGSFVLLGTGLLGTVGAVRRRFQKVLAHPAVISA